MKDDLPSEAAPDTANTLAPLASPDSPHDSRTSVPRWVIVGITMLVGAGGAFVWFREWGLAAIGVLVGLVVGLQIVRMRNPHQDDFGRPKSCPSAVGLMTLSVVAWMGVGFVWLGALMAGWLTGEGAGLLLMFILLPLTTFFWLIGGPRVSQGARDAIRLIELGQRPETDRPVVQRALLISRLLSLIFFGFVFWLLISVFQ